MRCHKFGGPCIYNSINNKIMHLLSKRYTSESRHLNSKTYDVIYYSCTDRIVLHDVGLYHSKILMVRATSLFVFYDLWCFASHASHSSQ